LFSALILLYFYPVLFQGKVMLYNDLYSQNFPSADWAFRTFKGGQLPFWVGSIFSGFPILDQGMMGFYNPVQFILFYCFTSLQAFHLTIILSYFSPLIFTFLFSRRLSLGRLPATVSAIVFVFGGFYLTRLVHYPMVNTMQYFPLGLYLIERGFQGKNRVLFWVSLVIGLQLVSGHPQSVIFSVFSYSFYYLLRCLFIRPRRPWALLRALLLWGLIVALGFGIGCIQFIPSQMLVSEYSHRRGGFDYDTAAEQSYVPWHLVTYLFPNFYGWGNPYQNQGFWETGGNYWEQACYVGILPLLLALFSLRCFRRNHYVRIFWILAGLSFLLALGRYTPLFALMRLIRNYRFFRMPIRWTVITSFSLAMLAGLGLADILQNPGDIWKRFGNKFLAVFRWSLVILLLLLITANLLFSWGRGLLYDTGMKLGEQFAVRKAERAGPSGKSLEDYTAILRRSLRETLALASQTVRLTSSYIYVPLLLLLAALALFSWLVARFVPPARFGFLALALIVADLVHFGLRYNPTFAAADVLSPPESVEFLKRDDSLYRIFQHRYGLAFQAMYPPYGHPQGTMYYWRELLKPNTHMIWGIDSATGYFPLRFKRADDLDRLVGAMLSNRALMENGLKILGMMNVKYILTGDWSGPEGAEPVYRKGMIRIYRNPYWLPRAFLVRGSRKADPKEILAGLKAGDLDLSREAWLEQDPGENRLSPGDTSEIVSWGDMRAVVRTQTAFPAVLFASIPNYPGWQARIDGRPASVIQADYLYLAVPIPSGEHTVELTFQSLAFKPGLTVTLISLAALILLLVRGPQPC
jgi:hypothetical protein